ncbi:sensor histidine kinase [Abyssisolibacter fermentans]|uniref:sensor histidine kinase n=1 Tax=Abyssisolibacter fermentans TaxID=1766203 RepID=UPI0009E8873E|nr:HAMP domain-containing sensor histidine kinase [Abyssisolibacter fermentans]
MKKDKLSFALVYVKFGIVYILGTLVFVYCSEDIFLSIIFSIFVSGLVLMFVLAVRKRIRAVIKRMDDMVDSAINNEEFEVSFNDRNISALENRLSRFISISKTVSKEREKEKNKIKSLISDISHQTKTAMANLLLYSQLLQEQSLSIETKQLVNEISASSEKLNFLIQALVKMSRLETGVINTSVGLSSVYELLQNEVSEIKNKAGSKNITIDLTCYNSIKAVFDNKWTGEAIYNILDNAVKYTEDGGEIKVSAVQYEIFTRIDISDNGIGIEDQEINNIFKRFYRCNNVSECKGVGIGLYLARKIISMQGGYIKVKSKPKMGSTFSVFLPNKI